MIKKLNLVLSVLVLIGFIYAFYILKDEGGYMINVNSENKEIVKESLNGQIDNIEDITKIQLGNGWHQGRLKIYHSFAKTEELYITEGMFKLGNLEKYISENGYKLSNKAFIILGISSFILIYLLSYRYVNRKRTEM